MSPAEVYRLLTQQIRRGLVIFPCLWLTSIVACSVLALIPDERPWAAAMFLVAIVVGVGIAHVRKRAIEAQKVSSDPQLVYWAHPIQPLRRGSRDASYVGSFSDEPIFDCTLLKLHLRDGTHFEASLPAAQMRVFLTWLSDHNPSVRFGDYDAPSTPSATRPA